MFLLGLVWCPSLDYAGCHVQGGGLRWWSAFSFPPPPPSPAMLPMRRSPCCPGWPPWSWGLCSTALGFGACLSFLSNWIYLHIVMAGSLSLHRLFWSHDKLGVCSGCGVHSCWAHGPELRLRSYGAGALLLCHTWVFVTQGSHLCPLHWQADSYQLSHQGNPACFLIGLLINLFLTGNCSLYILHTSLILLIFLTNFFHPHPSFQ